MKETVLLVVLLAAGSAGFDSCAEGIESVRPVLLPPPSFKGQVALAEIWVEPLKLAVESKTANEVIDTDDWFRRNGLSLPEWQAPNPYRGSRSDLPARVPTEFDGMVLTRAIDAGDRALLLYGDWFSGARWLYRLDSTWQRVLYAFDFSNYRLAPECAPGCREFVEQELSWAAEKDAILYVSHAHRTYAESSGGMNGYVTAIDIRSGEVIWRTEPLVCNSGNFIIHDDVIICGYGFTAEPDFVYQLNRHTGAVIAAEPVKSAPEYLVEKDGRLYVRCYDTDYVFGF